MTQLCRPFQPHDSLSRDHMLHVADSGGSLAGRIVAGAVIILLLALAAEFGEEPPQTVERLSLPTEAPPAIVVDRDRSD